MTRSIVLLILLLIVTFVFPLSRVSAQTASTASAVSTQETVDYSLPYPGILPDNPLYFLKAARDRVISWLIANPVKKASFDLLQSDKRLQMGVYLVNEDERKLPLAVSTMSKGQNYFSEAIGQVQRAKSQGMVSSDITQQLLIASEKHQEVLTDLLQRLPKKDQPSLTSLIQHMDTLHNQVVALSKK